MKTKNGFTMVEILGVLVILGIIITISIPAVINTLKSSENKDYERFIVDIKIAAENYIENNRDIYPELNDIGGTVNVPVRILVDNGFLNGLPVNPRTKSEISPADYVIVTTGDNKILEYDVVID